MRTFFSVLGTGYSCGNATFLRCGRTRVLVDAGIAPAELERRLAQHGEKTGALNAIVLTHEHADHSAAAELLRRRYGMPVYCNRGTLEGMRRRLLKVPDVSLFGDRLEIGPIVFDAIPLEHCAVAAVGFRIDTPAGSLAYLTDSGTVPAGLAERLRGIRALVLETYYDSGLLRDSSLPPEKKEKIRATHLSNQQAVCFAGELHDKDASLKQLVLTHFNRRVNHPGRAEKLFLDALPGLSVYTVGNAPAPLLQL